MWGGFSKFWYAFPQWLVMFTIFSCAYWPFLYLLWRNVFKSFANFWIRLFAFHCWILGALCVFWILIFIKYMIWTYFLLFSHFVDCLLTLWTVFWWTNFKHFHEVQFVYFFLLLPILWWHIQKNHYQVQCHEAFALFSSKSLIILVLHLGPWSILN